MQHLMGILYFFLMVIIIVAAYYASRFIATRSFNPSKCRHINLVDRVMLGKDKGILIIRAGDKILMLSEGAQGFNVICELNEADLEVIPQNDFNKSFKSMVDRYIKKKE